MSGWDDYIKILTGSAECIKKGAIISQDGDLWAKSADFNATADELEKLASQFCNYKDVPQTGIVLEGTKFIVPWTEENLIFGKKMKQGVFAGKTAK
uniref:Profilin n=1 Tax=Romanomermis culicivorax TaxID=13658 RepID=A0A915L2J6_ROMCU